MEAHTQAEYVVVSSWNAKQHEVYGERFVRDFEKYWPTSVRLRHVSEEELEADAAWAAYRNRYGAALQPFSGNCLQDGFKFAKKVFAIAMIADRLPRTEWLIWIDGDVTTNQVVSQDVIEKRWQLTRGGEVPLVTYLGRHRYHYSETGFVAFRIGHPMPRALIAAWRDIYLSGEIFRWRMGWGDGFAFDRARAKFPEWKEHFLSYTNERYSDWVHVWPGTVLAPNLEHHKGGRKSEAYGVNA